MKLTFIGRYLHFEIRYPSGINYLFYILIFYNFDRDWTYAPSLPPERTGAETGTG